MPFQIIRNDITKVKADAIVNTANPHPIIGSGTDSAIHEAAGPELLGARKKIGDIPPGSAASTPAFNLPAKYVIHTVGPSWVDGKHGEEAVLRRAYDAALNLTNQLRCRSVAFPLMAAGSYGFPRDLALSIAISAFTDFLMDHDMTVYLVLFNGKAFSLASSLFSDLKSFIDDNYVEEQTQKEYGLPLRAAPVEGEPCTTGRVRFKTCTLESRGTEFFIGNMTYSCPVWFGKICEKGEGGTIMPFQTFH